MFITYLPHTSYPMPIRIIVAAITSTAIQRTIGAGIWVSASLLSAMVSATESIPPYSPYTAEERPRVPLWGDTHVHSSLSLDAFGYGARLDPDTAFRFAAGGEINSNSGQPVRLSRPLDFLLVADHSEALGMMEQVRAGNPQLLADETVKSWNDLMNSGAAGLETLSNMWFDTETRRGAFRKLNELSTTDLQRSIWQRTVEIAEAHNQPGQFTTLLGYEWTSGPGGSNLHRVVVFRDGRDKVTSVLPYTFTESDRPEDLWAHLEQYEQESGGRALAIPHNGNLSNGLMFPTEQSYGGSAIDADYAEARRRWEPVVEVTQVKGDGEAHPLLSPDDEFADYGTWDFGNFAGVPKTPEMLPNEYSRSALKSGLRIEQKTGINPYQFGMIGSTDTHTALATADDDNFFGKLAMQEPSAERWAFSGGGVPTWKMVASGYAAVWAHENTREAIFDAIERREVYATTGPRITLRLFAGWEFNHDDLNSAELVKRGYQKGVPMGGELTNALEGKVPEGRAPGDSTSRNNAPILMISASKDPLGANLDRVQVVKGWIDGDNQSHEKVYDVAWSGERVLNESGKLPPVGNTVDIADASWSNSIGSVQLASLWRDPDFDPDQSAFYYVRVLEIPTPRWTAYDAKFFNLEMHDQVSMTQQERVYSSPIWYTP